MDGRAIDWVDTKSAVMLRSFSAVEVVHSRWTEDSTVNVAVALIKASASEQYSDSQLAVILSVLAKPRARDLRMTIDNAHLRIGESKDYVYPSGRSRHRRIKHSSFFEEDAIIYFELGSVDSTVLLSEPIVIYLDSIVEFNQQMFDLGRIELDRFNSDTANYSYN
jgi:hypothetical protein